MALMYAGIPIHPTSIIYVLSIKTFQLHLYDSVFNAYPWCYIACQSVWFWIQRGIIDDYNDINLDMRRRPFECRILDPLNDLYKLIPFLG